VAAITWVARAGSCGQHWAKGASGDGIPRAAIPLAFALDPPTSDGHTYLCG